MSWEELGCVIKWRVDSSGCETYFLSEDIHTIWKKHAIGKNEEDISKSKWFERGPVSLIGP